MASDSSSDDTRRLLRESVRAFVAKDGEMARVRASRERGIGFERAVWQTMADNGWLGLLFPESAGGFDLGFAEATIVVEEFGRALIPEPFVPAIILAAGALRNCEPTTLQAERLPGILAGEALPALAWQETRESHDPADGETRAVADDQGVRLSGTKRFILAAAGADSFLVTARGSDGVGLYWVDRQARGLSLSLDPTVDGVSLGSLQLRDVVVAADDIATRTHAVGAVTRAVDEARLCASAELIGVMSQAFDLTLAYIKQREQFGQVIGSFQVLQHRMVDLFVQQELARNTVAQAVDVFDSTTDPTRRAAAVSAAKARASEAALFITRQAIQLHGGIGFTDECDIGLYLKRALVLAAWLGNARVHRTRFGENAPHTASHGEPA